MNHPPQVVGIQCSDDGWAAASLAIAGHRPVWQNRRDPALATDLLRRLGLPPLATTDEFSPTAIIDDNLDWIPLDTNCKRSAPAAIAAGDPKGDDKPLITILICTYNRQDFLTEAIESAKAQRWPCEIVVVDDGSTDGTRTLLEETDGIRAFHQENTGKPGALEYGLSVARGDAVVILDDDDCLFPGAMSVLGKALFDHPELVAVCGDSAFFEDESHEVTKHFQALRLPGRMWRSAVLQQIPCLTGACLVRMSAQRAVGAYVRELIRGEDMDMFLRLARHGPIETLPFTTFLCRKHRGLRGAAAQRFQGGSVELNHKHYVQYANPIFRRRWQEFRDGIDRCEGFAWALGLKLRDLDAEAQRELSRWSGPYSSAEAWVCKKLGRDERVTDPSEALVVVDDGDPGALEECLLRYAENRSIWVDLEVHREPLEHIQLYWRGHYEPQKNPRDWVTHKGPKHLRLSSAPDWTPPPIRELSWLPPIPAIDALLALAVVRRWTLPNRSRPGLRMPLHPIVQAAINVRRCLDESRTQDALRFSQKILEALPSWRGSWSLAADCFDLAGLKAESQMCRKKAGS